MGNPNMGDPSMGDLKRVPQAVIDALARGDRATAIRLVNEAAGGDLKAAMAMVQRVATQLQAGKPGAHSGPHQVPETEGMRENRERTEGVMAGRRVPTVMPGDSGGRGTIVVVVIGAIALLAWWFFR